jgi:myo-inositol-1(or 4)-monophosphatase
LIFAIACLKNAYKYLKEKNLKMELEHTVLSKLLETAIVAARAAGQRAMEEINFVKVSKKADDELVTQADGICQQIIIDRIKQTYPDHGFIAEEGAEGKLYKQPPRGADNFWWVIDPIDGTNNFSKGLLLFAVSVAVMYEGEPVVGVIFEPATDSMFTAVKGGDAQLNSRRITASEDEISNFANIAFDSHFSDKVPTWAPELMLRTRYRNLGSVCLHLTNIARGSFVGSITTIPKLWDIAAGVLLAQCAGAKVTSWKGENVFPIDLDAYQGQILPILAANQKVHAELLEMIKS